MIQQVEEFESQFHVVAFGDLENPREITPENELSAPASGLNRNPGRTLNRNDGRQFPAITFKARFANLGVLYTKDDVQL